MGATMMGHRVRAKRVTHGERMGHDLSGLRSLVVSAVGEVEQCSRHESMLSYPYSYPRNGAPEIKAGPILRGVWRFRYLGTNFLQI